MEKPTFIEKWQLDLFKDAQKLGRERIEEIIADYYELEEINGDLDEAQENNCAYYELLHYMLDKYEGIDLDRCIIVD